MPYDESVAGRVQGILQDLDGITEKKMFGGLAFMMDGHMVCGVLGDELVLRLGNEGARKALDRPHTRPMDFTGKPIHSMVYLEPPGFEDDRLLRSWIEQALEHAATLPPK